MHRCCQAEPFYDKVQPETTISEVMIQRYDGTFNLDATMILLTTMYLRYVALQRALNTAQPTSFIQKRKLISDAVAVKTHVEPVGVL